MYRNSQYIFLSLLATLLFACIPSATRAQQVSIVDASWQGNDYVIRFDDSLSYTVDLEASDSMLVLHFARPVGTIEGTAPGPNGITATFSRNTGDSMVNLVVRGDQRVGYSTLWRPYSHRLIVHTFNWDSLNYPTEQYHKGLLSLELNLPDQARSSFSTALAFDNGETARQAASVLGVLYEGEGKDSLAQIYLRTPYDADDFMALANIYRRAGDNEKADKFEELFHQKEEEIGKKADSPSAAKPYIYNENNEDKADRPSMGNFFDDWRGFALVALAALFIIVLAVWFSRRPSKPTQTGHAHPHQHSHEHSHPGTAQTSATTVVPPSPPPTIPVVPVPPPAPVVQEPSAETGPNPIKSSLHAPQIIPDLKAPAETEAAETMNASEPIQLPQPDALPVDTELPTPQPPAAENPPVVPEPVAIPSPVEEPTPPAVSTTTSETAEAGTQQEESKRGSSQAEQLRRRMEAAMSGSTEAPAQRKAPLVASASEETTITEARRLNVSRDYVELRNRIAELRKRLEEE